MPDNKDYIVANGEFRELIKTVAVLATKVEAVESRMQEIGPWQCPVHAEQISTIRRDVDGLTKGQDMIKDTIGKRNLVAGVISACVTGVVLMAKYMVGK
jgi:hypothetical protein